MGRTLRSVATLLCTSLVLATPVAAHAATYTDQQRAARAAAYLRTQQRPNGSFSAFSSIGSTADAVSAFVSAGVGRTAMMASIGFLRQQVVAGHVNTIGLQAKVVLAVDAAKLDPKTFGGTNLLKAIRDTIGTDGHFGTSAVFDDALALLAIESAPAKNMPSIKAAAWLLSAQCPDGGWAYDKPYDAGTDNHHCVDSPTTDFFSSDSNTTSYVVQALSNMSDTDWVADPFAFFASMRDPVHHGWPYAASFPGTDANSTALVIQAYRAAGIAVPTGSIQALRDLQTPLCGAFAFTWTKGKRGGPDQGATIGAIPGLLRDAFPVRGTVAVGLPLVRTCT
jgi:Prenyltransferase and squalene oxidase repeat